MIYHIAHLEDLSLSRIRGSYFPSQYPQDGFVHCSTKNQVVSVANIWFLLSNDLVLFEIDEQLLNITLKYENLEGGLELYPHVYGEIPFSAIPRYAYFIPQSTGFSFPSEWIEINQYFLSTSIIRPIP
jgi:uncharacterized protein (DUF952 family)